MDDDISHVEEILSTLVYVGVTVRINKYHFFLRKLQDLGHMAKPGKLEIDKTNVEFFGHAQPSINKTKFRAFFRLCSVYRCFIVNFAEIAHPLSRLLNK